MGNMVNFEDSTSSELLTNTELSRQAKTISKEQRKRIVEGFQDNELFVYLKELFKAMQPNYIVEITRGIDIRGNDLLIVNRDKMTTDVIGVIVRREHILSKTLDTVDEVISTINNVLSIKSDKTITSSLPAPLDHTRRHNTNRINKVFVILTGNISNRGRDMLRTATKVPLEIFDIDWLVDNFTEFYPQVFFEGQVIDFIQSKIQNLETKSWHIRGNKNLSECFVEPLVQAVEVPFTVDEAKIAQALITRRLPFSRLRSIVLSNPRIILVGDPGTGKSAALAKLSIEMLKDSYSSLTKRAKGVQKAEVPILVTARDILEVENAEQLLLFYFGSPQVAERIKVRILMIDALDEIPSSKREEIVSKARMLSTALDCAIMLTSRKIDFLNTTPAGFKKYELLPFEANQALKLFEKIHGQDELLQSLKGELNKIRFQIPMVPLSLILLMELVEENNEVPASITELYERYTDIILGRHDKNKGIEVLFDYTVKKRFLASLAYKEFMDKARLVIPLTDYSVFLKKYSEEYSLDSNYINTFVREIERAGVLLLNEEEVSFGHRSFLDYFAAFYLFDKRDELDDINNLIIQNYFDDLWGDTIFFYFGHKKEISEKLLNKLLEFTGDSKNTLKTNQDKFFVGRLLQAAWHSPTKTKVDAISKAFELVPELRGGLLNLIKHNKWAFPEILPDFLILHYTNDSFRSSFLSKELQIVFQKNFEDKDYLTLMPLLWAMKPFITHDELDRASEKVLNVVSETSKLSAEDKTRTLLMLKVLRRGDKVMTKTIQKKIDLIQNKNPGILKKLLPNPIRGAKPYSKKHDVRRKLPK